MSALAPLALAAILAGNGHVEPERGAAPAPVTDVSAEAKAVAMAMANACERLDADAATKDFLRGPALVAVGSDGEIVDPEDYRASLRAFYASLSRLHFETVRQEFRALAPDLVLFVWSYKVEGTSRKSGPWVIESETASFLLRRIDGHWKFVFFQESAAPLRRLQAPKTQ